MAIASTGTNYFWPMLIFGIIALVSTVTLSYVIQKLKRMQGFAGLVNVMAECKGKPMGIYADKGGNLVPFVIERSKTNRGLIDHKFTLLHPDLSDVTTKHKFKNGPDVYFFPLPGYLPQSIVSSAALMQVAKKLRSDKRFSWIARELDLIALVFNNTESFKGDAYRLVKSCVSFGDEIPDGYLNREEVIDAEFTEDGEFDEDETDEFEEFVDEDDETEDIDETKNNGDEI